MPYDITVADVMHLAYALVSLPGPLVRLYKVDLVYP
jgi:hypothetical protein